MTGAELTKALLWKAKGEKLLTRRMLADRAKVGYNTIGEWLSGKASPTLDNFNALTEAAGYKFPEIWVEAERLAEVKRRMDELSDDA